MAETPVGTRAEDRTQASDMIPGNGSGSSPARPEQDDEANRLRGIVALPHDRDILFADEVILDPGKLPRWRPHIKVRNIVACPHLSLSDYKATWEAFLRQRNQGPTAKAWRTHCNDIKDGYAWNLSILNQSTVTGLEFEHRIVDFHEVFTIPREFLESLLAARGRARPRLLSPYREHLSQAFARYFMRVGLPVAVDTVW